MRGAFYVATALLITNSIRTAAEADQPGRQPMSYHDGVVPGKSSPRRFLLGSHEPHDKFAVSAANEERMPEPSAKITASLSEEALDTVRKAAHFTFDLNAPPEETPTGMVEAYQVLRQKDPRTVTASHPKRTAEALTSLDEALGYANPKYSAGGQSKKLRTSVSFKATEVRNSISRDRMTPTPRTLSDDDVQNVHKLYMEHLERNLAVFAPTVGETRMMLGLVNDKGSLRPSLGKTYAQYVRELMNMNLKALKELGLDPKTVLKPNLQKLLEQNSKDLEDIQLSLLRLLRLKRWKHMYRDFFDFCISNHGVCSNSSPTSTLRIELQVRKKAAESSIEVAPYFAVLGSKKTMAERNLYDEVKAAVTRANLVSTDKKFAYALAKEVFLDDYLQ